MESPRSLRRHQISPSFADSAIDIESTGSVIGERNVSSEVSPKLQSHAVPLSERISSLARRIATTERSSSTTSSPRNGLDEQNTTTIHEYLDTIESLLDPRPELSREIGRSRPRPLSPSSRTTIAGREGLTKHSQSFVQEQEGEGNQMQQSWIPDSSSVNNQLQALLKGATKVTAELKQRRIEARHIHDLYTFKCERLAQKIIELENEVHELQSDILEDSIELEGIRGTVRGLESWISRWERQRELISAKRHEHPPSTRRKKKSRSDHEPHPTEQEEDNDCDALLDGINAWMRGWQDVEEGFRIRARRRKLRRERQESTRQSQALVPPGSSERLIT